MDFDEIENLNPDQILDMYEDILETPLRMAASYTYCLTSSYCTTVYYDFSAPNLSLGK